MTKTEVNQAYLIDVLTRDNVALKGDLLRLTKENARLTKENHALTHPKIETKRVTNKALKAALRRAVKSHGHEYNCSAAHGMERDCTCGWLEVRQLAAV